MKEMIKEVMVHRTNILLIVLVPFIVIMLLMVGIFSFIQSHPEAMGYISIAIFPILILIVMCGNLIRQSKA